MPDPRQKLYNAISSKYDLGSYDEFNSKMNNPDSRQKLYNSVSKDFDLGSYDEFNTKIGSVKKKESASVSTVGSSALSKSKSPITKVEDVLNTSFDQKSVKPKTSSQSKSEKITPTNFKTWEPDTVSKYGSLSPFEEYQRAKSLSNDEFNSVKQDLDAEINNEGLMNNITNLAKDWWNGVFRDEKDIQLDKNPLTQHFKDIKEQRGNDVTPEEVAKLAYDMELKKRSASLSESKERDYLKKAQDQGKIEPLKKEQLKIYDERSKQYNTTYLKDGALKNGINEQGEMLVNLKKELDKENPKSEVYKQKAEQFASLLNQYKQTFSEYETNSRQLQKLGSEVSGFEHNLDMLKRDYGYWSNFAHRIGNSLGDTGKGLVTLGIESPIDSVIGSIETSGGEVPQLLKGAKEVLQQGRSNYDISKEQKQSKHSKEVNVDDIHSLSDFGAYALNLTASQAFNLAAASTGIGGLAVIGTSATGQKRADMLNEMDNGADYDLLKQVSVPLLSGGAEMIGGAVDRLMLGRIASTIRSVASSERRLIAEGMAKKFATDYLKSTSFEVVEETSVQMFNNILDKYALGKSDINILDGVKDAAAGALVLTSTIQAGGGLTSMGINSLKPFSYDGKITKLNDKIVKLESQLSNPNIDDSTRSIVTEQIEKLKSNTEAVIKDRIGDIESLSNEQFQEILSLEKDQSSLRNKANEIKKSNLDVNSKEEVLKGLEEEFKTNDNRRVALLQRGSEIQLERLPQEDQKRLKEQALDELKSENNTEEVSDNQIAKRALKLYANEQTEIIPEETTTNEEETSVVNNETVVEPEYDTKADLEFLENLEPDERQEIQEELNNSPIISDVINTRNQYTYNGEVGNFTIDGQQVVFETNDKIHELGNINEISDAKLLEFGIEPVQELNIEVENDFSVSIDGKRYVNSNSNPNDAITIGKNGEYSITLENENGQSRTIRGQRAEQIAYNYKLKEYENATEQQIEQATETANTEIETRSTSVSQENGNTKPKPKNRARKQRSLKEYKSPLTKSQREEAELNRLIEEEQSKKEQIKQQEEAELKRLIDEEEFNEINRLIAEEERAKDDPIYAEYISLRDKSKRNKKEEARLKKLDEAVNAPNLLSQDVNLEPNKPITLKISENSEPYTVSINNGTVKFSDRNGKEPSAPTRRKLQKEYVKTQDFTKGKLADESQMESEKNMNQVIAKHSENPTQISEAISNINNTDYESDLDYKQVGIAERIGKVERSSFIRFGDKNYINQSIGKQYIAKKGKGQQLDTLAQEISEDIGVEVTEQDIVDFIVENSSGVSSFRNRQKNSDLHDLKLKFEQLTGLPATETVLNAIAESNNNKKEIQNNLSSLEFYTDEELINYDNERQEWKSSVDQLAENDTKRQDSTSNGNEPGIQRENTKGIGEKETAKSEPTGIDVATNEELERLFNERNGYEKTIDYLDKLIKEIDDFGNNHLSMGIPLVVAKEVLKAMRLAVVTSKAANDIVKAGHDYLINTDWYKNLSKRQQSKITFSNFKNLIAESIRQTTKAEKEINNLTQELGDLRQKLVDDKLEALEISKMIKEFLKSNKITGKITPNEINRLVTYANKISIAKDKVAAFDDFVNTFKKIETKAQQRTVKLSDRVRVENRVKKQLAQGKTEQEIIDSLPENSSERKIAEDYFERTKVRTDDQIRTKLNRMQLDYFANRYKRGSLSEKINKAYVKTVQAFFDRAFTFKKAMNQAGMQYATSLYIATKGAPGYANYLYDKAHKEIFSGLTTKQNDDLNLIIRLRRIIALENDGVKKGKDPMVHASNFNLQQAEQALKVLESDLGAAEFASLQERANKFYKQQQSMLTKLYENGIITEEFYNDMKDVEYIKTRYLDFLTDADAKSFNVSKGASTNSGIETLSNGWNGTVELNANELLAQSISTTTKALASNRLNLNLITEFQKNKQKYDTLSNKNQLSESETEFVKNFKAIENSIISASSKSSRAPIGYSKISYFENGENKVFFMEDAMYKVYSDNIASIWGSNVKDLVQTASGVNLVKTIATGQNPTFFITNTPRDFFWITNTSMAYSNFMPKAMVQLTKDFVKGSFDVKRDSIAYQKAVEYGLMMDFLHLQGKLKFDVNPRSIVGKSMRFLSENKGTKAISYLWEQGMILGKYSEIGFRMAVFNRTTDNLLKDFNDKNQTTYKSVENIDESLYPSAKERIYTEAVVESRESTVDFNQGGHLSKDLEAMIPYFNAATQGTRMLVEKVADNPVPTILRFTQTAGIVTGMGVGLSMWILQGLKDDDEDVVDAYNRFYSGVSKFDRANYIVIPIGKDDKGEFKYTRIALPQALTPFFALSRGITHDAINKYYDKENFKSETFVDTDFALQKNLMPIEFGVSENAAKVPILKAAFSYVTGYDFFREQDISIKRGKVDVIAEGFESKSVEGFYKEIGQEFKLSPARLKTATEALITTPSTNIGVGVAYGTMNMFLSKEGSDKSFSEFALKSFGGRVIKNTSDFNRKISNTNEFKDKNAERDVYNARLEYQANTEVKRYYEGELKKPQAVKAIKEIFGEDKRRVKNYIGRLDKNYSKFSSNAQEIKFASADKKASLLVEYFGNNLFNQESLTPKQQALKKELLKMKVLTPSTRSGYNLEVKNNK